MASKTKVTPQKEEALEKEGLVNPPDTPLLDLSDAAVKKLIRSANKRGYVTHDQINSVLTSAEVNSEQIEDVLAMLSEMGVNVVETEQASDEGDESDEETQGGGGGLVEVQQKVPAKSEAKEPNSARGRSRSHVSARHGLGGAALARGRDRHRQAHRGWPRGDDCRAVRKPAHLPGDRHLARRAQRRKDLPARYHRSRSDLCGSRRQGDAGGWRAGRGWRRRAGRAGAAAADGRASDRSGCTHPVCYQARRRGSRSRRRAADRRRRDG